MTDMGGEREDDFVEWNKEMKKEILGYIEDGITGIECIKKANNIDAVQMCMKEV